eukprot:scaffold2353_cov167-Amphora_coffeaeformis.AAC.41
MNWKKKGRSDDMVRERMGAAALSTDSCLASLWVLVTRVQTILTKDMRSYQVLGWEEQTILNAYGQSLVVLEESSVWWIGEHLAGLLG